MTNNKKLLVVVLIILTLVLGGASIFISQQLQQNQSTESAAASARDDDAATSDLYKDIEGEFSTGACSNLLTEDIIDKTALDNFTELKALSLTTVASYPNSNVIGCNVFFDDGSQIDIEVNTYPSGASSAKNVDTVSNQINDETLDSVIKSGIVIYSPYSFGEASDGSGECQTNIFHKLNDFEYISLRYKNFNEDCEDMKSLSTEVAYVVSVAAHNITSKLKSVQ